MRRRVSLGLVGLIALAFIAGHAVRGRLGVEISAGAIHAWVATLSWKGPLLYLSLVTFRQFLLLPSAVLLPVGGLCFGALAGTALGSAGIFLSGFMKFTIARAVRRNWIRNPGHRFESLTRRIERAGPVVIGVTTAHPAGPMSVLHWGAGLSSIPLNGFLLALGVGGLVRAGTFAMLGSSLLSPNSMRFYAAVTLLIALLVVPFVHPAWRRRLLGSADLDTDAANGA